jgi:hydroxypyruvate reductase
MVDGQRVPVPGRLFVVGAGKAAVPMARAAEVLGGDMVSAGLVITKDGQGVEQGPERIEVRSASHPIPDERGVRATRELLELVRSAKGGDVVLALISGGGSALLVAPRPPVILADLATTTDLLLRAGAPIQDLNAVRIPLSEVKGGGLRRAAGAATVMTLILSDVLGNDPQVIASGPTVPGDASPAKATAVLERYGLTDRVPSRVREALDRAPELSGPPGGAEDRLVIVADNATAVEAARREAVRRGLRAEVAWTAREGEAADLGREWVARCRAARPDVDVLLGGGEATVTVRGSGVGGRNTEFALAAAMALDADDVGDWTVASLATDGEDGKADAAGAIADAETIGRARQAGIDPVNALAENDSARVFEAAGGVVRPGPTGTNVNDLYLAVRRRGPLL